ncbi:MAG: Flp family type IVb pilin [Brevundimonas sp.]|uniref:Flp family type IVb pilin n=1 Tax=Brevundimonas sp. TaxID=1871086 RepID=UPI00391D8F3F
MQQAPLQQGPVRRDPLPCSAARLHHRAARLVRRFARDRSGATAIEYGLIISLIFLVIVGAVTAFGNHATDVFNTAAEAIASAMSG